jgi:hypothetical protein
MESGVTEKVPVAPITRTIRNIDTEISLQLTYGVTTPEVIASEVGANANTIMALSPVTPASGYQGGFWALPVFLRGNRRLCSELSLVGSWTLYLSSFQQC